MIGIVCESLPMTSVRDWLLQIRKSPTRSWDDVLPVLIDLARQTACGLDCLEKKSIVHRDLSKIRGYAYIILPYGSFYLLVITLNLVRIEI